VVKNGKIQEMKLNANMRYKEQVNTRTGERRWVPVEEGIPQAQQNIFEKIGGFLTPIASKTSQIIGGTLGLKSRAAQEAEESQRKAEEMNRALIGRARVAPPEQKETLLRASRDISGRLGQISQERLASAQQAIPIKRPETWSPVKQGIGTAAELGAWMFPTIGPRGAGIGRAFLRGATTGAPTAAMTALAQSLGKDETVKMNKIIGASLLGGITGGTISGGFALGNQVFKKFTEWLPVVQRRIGLKIPIKETRLALQEADDLAKETLTKGKFGTMAEEVSGGEFKGTPPGSYRGLKKWLIDMFSVADDELNKQTVNTTFSIDDIVQGKQQEIFKKNLKSFQKGLGLRLEFEGGKGKDVVFKSEKYKPIINALLRGERVSFADLNSLRRVLDASRKATFRTMQKSGISLSEKSGNRAVSMINTANLIRDALRSQSPEKVAELFDMQSFAMSLLNRMDRAISSYQKRLMPTRWEATILAGAALGEAATGIPLTGPATMGTVAYRLPKLPQVQKFLYGAGQVGQRAAPAASALEQFLRKGATIGAGRL